MANSIFNLFGGRPQGPAPMGNGPFANMANFINAFSQFRSTFQGDPRQKVQELINSGQMTQEQFQQLSQMATQLQNGMKGKR